VIDTLYRQGRAVMEGLKSVIAESDASDFLGVAGNPTWSFLTMQDCGGYTLWQIKTLFLQEMFSRGILTIGTHNMSYSHGDDEVGRLLQAYGEVIPMIAKAVRNKTLESALRCEPLQPLFKVR
jgi:glutamate-1-semialdehyde 2,1-aminomutase